MTVNSFTILSPGIALSNLISGPSSKCNDKVPASTILSVPSPVIWALKKAYVKPIVANNRNDNIMPIIIFFIG